MARCDWCNKEVAEWVEYDETFWHPVCLAEYIHAKNAITQRERRKEKRFKCPMGDHYHVNP